MLDHVLWFIFAVTFKLIYFGLIISAIVGFFLLVWTVISFIHVNSLYLPILLIVLSFCALRSIYEIFIKS